MLQILPDDYHTSAMMHCPQGACTTTLGLDLRARIMSDRVHIKGCQSDQSEISAVGKRNDIFRLNRADQ